MRHLRFVREERKAVIAISQGWRLYGEDPTLRRPVRPACRPVPPMGLRPAHWPSRRTVDRNATEVFDRRKCEQERQSLSMLRNDQRFIDILRQANTGNTSFYPVDPRGLVVFDEHIVPISPAGRWKSMRSTSSRIRGA